MYTLWYEVNVKFAVSRIPNIRYDRDGKLKAERM